MLNRIAKFLGIVLLISIVVPLYAQHEDNQTHHNSAEKTEKKDFNAGEYVLEHVMDAYSWHVFSYKGKHYSIPLPIILYSKNPQLHEGKSLSIFMSSKFHHGHAAYNGYAISHSEENKGKIVEQIEGHEARPFLDVSITKTVAGMIFFALLLLFLAFTVVAAYKKNRGKAPKGLQNLFEPLIVFIRDEVAIPSIGKEKHTRFMPFLLSVFFFVLISNLFGLIPFPPFNGGVTSNIAVTLVLALFTFIITTLSGNKHYWKEIYNPDVPWWLKYPIPLMPIVELTGVFTKPFVLMVRLFANMLAGHMIVAVFISLIFVFSSLFGAAGGFAISPISLLFSIFIVLLDILVSFIQAYVFTLLSAIYFGMATSEHH
ncbi:MAG: ATP synthase F0 subunit A [Draconibacterium sp.]|nr:MAG: ATP synthase F0 subunit A [Draconibacterium sp.]